MVRWKATIFYRSEAAGLVDVTHYLDEMLDLDDVVESGPHWDTIERIEILRIGGLIKDLTLEAAAKL